jgi:hypothetical protein
MIVLNRGTARQKDNGNDKRQEAEEMIVHVWKPSVN